MLQFALSIVVTIKVPVSPFGCGNGLLNGRQDFARPSILPFITSDSTFDGHILSNLLFISLSNASASLKGLDGAGILNCASPIDRTNRMKKAVKLNLLIVNNQYNYI
jgi:hypothetical protein